MKSRGTTQEFMRERNADLFRALRSHLHSRTVVSAETLMKLIAETPSSRFWVSERRATEVVGAIIAGRSLHNMRPCKREMFREIHRRVMQLRSTNPTAPLYILVEQVVNSPAPKFYLTPGSIREIISRIRRGIYPR